MENGTPVAELLTGDDPLTRSVIGAAIEVHKVLGPGLLESAYRVCLAHELNVLGVPYKVEVDLPVTYKNVRLDCGYRMDLVIADTLILEIKAVEKLLPIHQAQLLTYMRLARKSKGLLLNFNTHLLRDGIKRLAL